MSNIALTQNKFYLPDEDNIQLLKRILEIQLQKPINTDEAKEISIELISLYECLARDEVNIIKGDNSGRQG